MRLKNRKTDRYVVIVIRRHESQIMRYIMANQLDYNRGTITMTDMEILYVLLESCRIAMISDNSAYTRTTKLLF
jgi:hypothetical protein